MTLPRFKPYWHPHMDHKPVYVESRRDFAEQLKKRGLGCKD